jgi:hypothetical protein
MDVGSSQLSFPSAFCCNCGALDCETEIQDTRVTRYFGLRKGETTFHLPVPVCARCRHSIRRRPPGFFSRLSLLATCLVVSSLLFALANYSWFGSEWLLRHVLVVAAVVAVIAFVLLTKLRRPKPPQTSFYQPVRIKVATVAVSHVEGAASRVTFMKLAFANPDYLNAFRTANAEAIEAGGVSVTST